MDHRTSLLKECIVIPRFTCFSITRFSITQFLDLVQKICITRFYSIKFQLNTNFFDNFFCLYYDLCKANFDLRNFWVATASA